VLASADLFALNACLGMSIVTFRAVAVQQLLLHWSSEVLRYRAFVDGFGPNAVTSKLQANTGEHGQIERDLLLEITAPNAGFERPHPISC
jgi:hypothetical protein